jgi:hypothetical protein
MGIMAYPEDWTFYDADGGSANTTSDFFAGNAAIELDSSSYSGVGAMIYDPSISADPEAARVTTHAKATSTSNGQFPVSMVFCMGTDGSGNNTGGYIAGLHPLYDEVALFGGSDIGSPSELDTVSVSNTSYSAGSYEQYRISMWRDAGDVYARVEWYDGSSFTQLGSDLVATDSTRDSGAVGVTSGYSDQSAIRYDETEVYY